MQFYTGIICALEVPDRISEGIDSAEFGHFSSQNYAKDFVRDT
jgi:hypothetical protein